MKRFYAPVLACAAAALLAPAAQAGFTVLTGLDQVVNTDLGTPGGSVGDSFSVGGILAAPDSQPGGTFASYVPDTPFDPQITGADLNRYRFNLTGTVASVAGSVATYTGSYLIFYDQDLNGEPNDSLTVSGGDFNGTATFDFLTGETALFTGTLTQTQGASNPVFADLSYGGNDVFLTGSYIDSTLGDGPSQTGLLTVTLRQNALAIPEPATVALCGAAGLALVAVRRK
jgi:hypothetical protein